MRGARGGLHHRFTPTGVGTAGRADRHCGAPAVHPHRRGDGADKQLLTRPPRGSPPQAWGRLARPREIEMGARFTPTGVGTACSRSRRPAPHAVHPHRRGDGDSRRYATRLRSGSPPQAWGRQRGDSGHARAHRFTPTGVGTASTDNKMGEDGTVHPHRRGDGRERTL